MTKSGLNDRPSSDSKKAARIMVVEDDFDIQQIVCVYLKHAGFDVQSASDGNEAIRIIPEFRPDLIVLDLMMQPVDGWAVLEWLRSSSSSTVPVLVLTALNHLKEQIHGFEKGAIEYMTKPTQPRAIVERIRTILTLTVEQRAMLQRKRIDEQRQTLERVSAPQPDEFVY
jgi:DNA-binding response OmpR family regulator